MAGTSGEVRRLRPAAERRSAISWPPRRDKLRDIASGEHEPLDGGKTSVSVDSVLSYFRSYFDPTRSAGLANHSTGLIARHLHELLSRWGPVDYYDESDRPEGLSRDLLVSHFWSFARVWAANRFRVGVAVYVLSDPVRARDELQIEAERRGVPMPDWDLPPPDFDHDATLEAADVVLLVGNHYTLQTFPARWQPKIRLVNYSVDPLLWRRPISGERRNEFVYAATTCGLRKGFLDVLDVWRTIPPTRARLHVVGRLEPPYDQLLAEANTGSIVAHGWIDSDRDEYLGLLRSCRFAYVPTWVEGQMGTLLEAVQAGCVPVTTRASGLDDRVLAHGVVIEPRDLTGQRAAIEEVLSWSHDAYQRRQAAVVSAAERHHNWDEFERQVTEAVGAALEAKGLAYG
jgi:glycosyltransferase involved in cell wall biosynthesis